MKTYAHLTADKMTPCHASPPYKPTTAHLFPYTGKNDSIL